jgi:hypothetical protein
MTAPPLMGVQRHYKQQFADKKEFIQAIVNWVNSPNADNSLMPGAISRFNIMPALPIGNDKLEKIGAALYDMNFTSSKGKHHNGKCGMGKCGR